MVRLVRELPDNYRQVVMLFYMEERSYEEVARLLGFAHRHGEDVSAPRAQTTGYYGGGG